MDHDNVKEVMNFYAVWSVVMTVLTIILRPFISWRQIIRDCIITFLVSFLCGLCLEYFSIPVPVKCGISGIAGLFAIMIYGIVLKLLTGVKEDPVGIIQKIKGVNYDRHKPTE